MAQRSLRRFIDLIENQQPWGITRTAIFDESLRDNLKEYPDLKERLLRFIEQKSPNPLQTRYGKHDRPFTGPLVGFAHCHLRPDAILIYTLANRCINLIMMCSHSEIEGKRMKSTRKKLSAYLGEGDLIEKYQTGFKGIKGEMADIFRNPTTKEWRECEQYNEVRGMVVGDDLLIWNPYTAVHQMVRDELNLPREAIPLTIMGILRGEAHVTVTDNSAQTPWHHNPEVARAIRSCGYVQNNFTDIEISYYDESIVGDWNAPEDDGDEDDDNA